jgi:hypothetical protein
MESTQLAAAAALILLIFIGTIYIYLFPTPLSEYFTDKPPRKYPQTSIE